MLTDADHQEVAQLFATYAHAVDRRRFDLLERVFVPDGGLDTGHGVRTGLDEITTAIEGLHGYEATYHLLGQTLLDGGPDTATAETYCDAHHLLVETGADGEVRTDTVMKIRYADDLVRTDDGWRITMRRLHLDWTEQRVVG